MANKLFNSYTDPIPSLRHDIQVIDTQQDGQEILYFHDNLGYATPNFAIPKSADAILSLINGQYSVQQILTYSSDEVTKEQILGYVRFLDEHALLDSTYFAEHAELIESEYEKSPIHKSITAGSSFSADSTELVQYLEKAFSDFENSDSNTNAKALYAPHIDPRVGIASYVKAFSSIRDIKPKRVVLLATSHYAGMYNTVYENKPFILSRKDFELPNGTVKADQKAIDNLLDKAKAEDIGEITDVDRAYRIEHSIELHLLFLNHIWNHDFEIVPILVAGFDELLYLDKSAFSKGVQNFSELLHNLYDNDEDTFFLISGDLSHVGKKFGDEQAANEMIEDVKVFDQKFLEQGTKNDAQAILAHMKTNFDAYRVCGFSPLLTFMKAFTNLRGTQLSYDIWDEKEQDSAVTFGSILFE